MQIPFIPILNHLQKQNPSFLSPIHLIAFISFKWSALVLALLATVRVIIIFRRNTPSIALISINDDDDYDFSDTDEDSDNDNKTVSSSQLEDNEEADTGEDKRRKGECFRYGGETGAGSFLRRSSIGDLFSLSEIDNIRLGFGFGFDDSKEESVVSIYNQEQRTHPSRKTTTMAMSNTSPAVVVSAGENVSGVRIWDTRLRRRMPPVTADWGAAVPLELNPAEYTRFTSDDGRYRMIVGDIRNFRLPFEDVTESYVDTWLPNSFIFKLQ
ncbi:hypothetical protein Lal_00011952 [Lupinus albus]|uniref:Uncharacterized protein n=1 Tax=Lupinus albus TaxID=3870 RepID=A0A6A4QEZ3_LUPAL|nr:hypothetical protein Lalb_Chr06g0166021 [Lupinus albus]KAF1880892.1 hypothetical protein Lal_00011952 [Lupinus albus]